MSETEIRTAALGPFELRAAPDGPGKLGGYAAVFNRLSQNLGGFVERVDPGAFTKSLADDLPVMARYNHDGNWLLGTTESHTLRLSVDGTGLPYEIDLPDTQAGRDVATLASRGDLRFSSFAFETIEDEWSVTDQGFPLRTLLAVRLIDVAPVNNPAYRDTTTGLRSLQARIGADPADMDAAEIRSILTTSPADAGDTDDDGQVDNHPKLLVAQRRLALLSLQ